jgi:hypothetical protein
MTQTTYVSPDTNKTYTVIESQSERGAWDADGNYAPKVYTQFSIYDGEKMVQFAFDKEGIAAAVKHYEVPGPDLGSRFD